MPRFACSASRLGFVAAIPPLSRGESSLSSRSQNWTRDAEALNGRRHFDYVRTMKIQGLPLALLLICIAVVGAGCSKGACVYSDYCTNGLSSTECSNGKLEANKTCQDLGFSVCSPGTGVTTCRKK